MLETGGWQKGEAKRWKAMEISKDQRLEKLGQAPPRNLLAGSSLTPRTPGLSHHMPVNFCYRRLGQMLCEIHRPFVSFLRITEAFIESSPYQREDIAMVRRESFSTAVTRRPQICADVAEATHALRGVVSSAVACWEPGKGAGAQVPEGAGASSGLW